jgi:hypothetical protein
MKKNIVICSLCMTILFLHRCSTNNVLITSETLLLKWIKSFPDETTITAKKGLLWSFAFSGATLPSHNIDKAIAQINDSVFAVNFSYLGFDANALNQWNKIISFIKQSIEYKKNGNIDIGRFLMFSIHSSKHYYAITGTPDSIASIIENPLLTQSTEIFPVTKSAVAKGSRILYYSNNIPIENSNYIAVEGHGNIEDKSFKPEVLEVISVMKNGQLRYAIYDKLGKLMDASPTLYGNAGKPTKCMWCHEGKLATLHTNTLDLEGYKNSNDFVKDIIKLNKLLANYRKNINTALNYNKHADHQYSEWLYLSFMEPTAERLAAEWNLSVQEIKEKLKKVPTHVFEEDDYSVTAYFRNDVEPYAPFTSVPIPIWAREPNTKEPNILHY